MNSSYAHTCKNYSPPLAVRETSSRPTWGDTPRAKHVQSNVGKGRVCWETICWKAGHFLYAEWSSEPSASYTLMYDAAHPSFSTNYPKTSCTDSSFSKVTALMVDTLMVVSNEQSGNVMLARNYQRSLLTLIKAWSVETTSDPQKTLLINEWIQSMKRTTFWNPLLLFDTFDLLTVNFFLCHSDYDCWSFIGFLHCEFCFAVMPALARTVFLLSCLEMMSYVNKASDGTC